jgi:glycosyltransferase involved in cell wall biosynthesis
VVKPRIVVATGVFSPDIGGPAKFAEAFSDWLGRNKISSGILTLTDGSDYVLEKQYQKRFAISRQRNLISRMMRTVHRALLLSNDSIFLVNGLFIEFSLLSMIKKVDYVAKVPGDIVWERATNQGNTSLSVIDYQGNEDLGKKVMRFLFARVLKRASRVIVPSMLLKEIVAGWGVAKDKITIMPNSVDLQIHSKQKTPKKEYDLITVGRLIPLKGVHELIEVSHTLGLRLAIVGSGPEESSLRNLSERLSSRVEFLRELEPSDVATALSKSRFFVLNSSHEGSPHSLIEAMASRLVVLARENSGTSEIINHKQNGFLYRSKEELVELLKSLVNDSQENQLIADTAFQDVLQKYNQETNFKSIYQVLIHTI